MNFFKNFQFKIKRYYILQNTRREIKYKKKLNVGSANLEFDKDWFSCDIDVLDITNISNWKSLLGSGQLHNIFAEHVWEHLSREKTKLANENCYKFLGKNGRLRIAVPDGYHPNQDYIDYVKPGGNGAGADDHKILYNYRSLSQGLLTAGFKIELLEYWDEKGKFHFKDWSLEDGKVIRSKRFDNRNKNGELNYTSLIIDAIKN